MHLKCMCSRSFTTNCTEGASKGLVVTDRVRASLGVPEADGKLCDCTRTSFSVGLSPQISTF